MMREKTQKIQPVVVAVFLALLLAVSSAMTRESYAAGEDGTAARRVFDQAGLLTAAEGDSLEQQVEDVRSQMGMDLVLVTTADAGGYSSEAYADNYYEAGGFGVGKDHSGVLFLIDMDNRQVQVSSEGEMLHFLTDQRVDQILDDAYVCLQEENYAEAFRVMVSDLEAFYKRGIPSGQYSYDRDTGAVSARGSIKWYDVLIAFAVSAFSGASVCLGIKRQYAMEETKRQAANYLMAYRGESGFQFHTQEDRLIDKSVAQRLVSAAVRSGGTRGGLGGGSMSGRTTTHRSSGGRMHGGGGRKF